MAARWNLEDSLNRKFFFFLLVVVIQSVYVTGVGAQNELHGTIGGNVTFRCPMEPKKVKMLYLQRGLSFVNGFFVSKNISEKWENTQMDEKNLIINMHSLNASHEGSYECHIDYENDPQTYTTSIHLRLTANFSKPQVTVLRRDKNSWIVMCSSHGGYPSSKMIWNTSWSTMVKVLNSSETPDPATLTINSSSTAVFNCTTDETQFISCSVKDVTSKQFSVCTAEPPGPTDSTGLIVIVAIVFIVIFGIAGIAVLLVKMKKCGRTEGVEVATLVAVRPEQVNRKEGPETPLTTKVEAALTGGQGAP